jgi:hypothetical protein
MNIYIIIWFVVVVLLSCKTMFDQSKLVKLWREQSHPGAAQNSFRDIRLTFSKHPDQPQLAKQASKVRFDLLLSYGIMIAGFLVFSLLALNS